jgi:hypothetical protein
LAAIDTTAAPPIPKGGKLSKTPNPKKFIFQKLRNTHGVFLTRLDENSKILAFLGGAMRTAMDRDTDEVAIITPEDIVRGIEGVNGRQFLPQPKVITLAGEARRMPYRVTFHANDYFEYMVKQTMSEGCMWGLLSIYPSPTRHKIGAVYNGCNHEEYLDPRTWRQLVTEDQSIVRIGASGGGDMNARLAPQAVQYTSTFPTAWEMAVRMCDLFGGLKGAPTIPGMPPDAVVHKLTLRELDIRAKNEVAERLRRSRMHIERQAQQKYRGHATVGSSLPEDSAQALWQIEQDLKLAETGAGETSSGV